MSDGRRTHLDLFSGIGGFALAAKWAGFETIAFCECEPFAQRVLRKNFPDVPILDDVREIDGRDFLGTTLISGGFPCQPYSHAGKRRGKEDHRALGGEMVRLVSEARPRWVLGENVAGFATMGLDEMLSDLEDLRYSCEAIIIPACAIDAPHRRDRVWIVGHDNDEGRESSPMGDSQHDGLAPESQFRGERVTPDSLRKGREGSVGQGIQGDLRRPPGGSQDEFREWLAEPGVCRVAHGLPNRVERLAGLGNAIVPQVAYEILRLMT